MEADAILKRALSPEGAERLVGAWIDHPSLPYVSNPAKRSGQIELVRGSAAKGIAISQNEDNMRLVKEMYAETYNQARNNPDLLRPHILFGLMDAMIFHDLIQEIVFA